MKIYKPSLKIFYRELNFYSVRVVNAWNVLLRQRQMRSASRTVKTSTAEVDMGHRGHVPSSKPHHFNVT